MIDKKIYIDTMTSVTEKKKHAYELALSDFMDFALEFFDVKAFTAGTDEYTKHVQACYQKEPEYTVLALRWLSDVSDAMDRGEWLDVFGELYEEMYLSRGKAAKQGQFYTPAGICDMMSQITAPQKDHGRVADCAAGSGRLLLAHYMQVSKLDHSAGRRFEYEATDNDPMACKQCALNMMAHGLNGKVICQSSLTLDTPTVVYHINEVRYPFNSGYYSVRAEYPAEELARLEAQKEAEA